MPNTSTDNTVNLFIPCEMDMFSPSIPDSIVIVLQRLGYKVVYNPETTCCGRKFFMAGAVDCAKELGNKLLSEYDPQYPIVTPSAACAAFIKTHYRKLFENTAVPAKLKQFTNNVYELCDFIVNVHGVTSLGNKFNQRVFYYESCSAKNYYPVNNAPRTLLKNTLGLDLLENNLEYSCCGANGNFAMENPAVSDKILNDLVGDIYKLGTQYVTSTDIHCLQYIDSMLNANGGGMEVIHIADILLGDDML
ncbi:(Fe-S)-binding protein [Bacteroidales bacterium OttesenSCG-928-B11]|nr:(Fe-S)-binding protein [Bacteroidales bacterium OttesenSCG-928-B11]